jgi:hypothetical protein
MAESRTSAFTQGTVAGSPELARKAMLSQVQAGGLLPGQNGRSGSTYSADQPYISEALKAGY